MRQTSTIGRLRKTIWYNKRWLLLVSLVAANAAESAAGPFAASVIEYAPAPGQFVNVDAFNDPTEALGPPSGG